VLEAGDKGVNEGGSQFLDDLIKELILMTKTGNQIDGVVRILRSGGVVVFPTDTVWGVGAAISNEEGLKKLYRIKGREKDKPTAVLVADLEMALGYGVFSERAGEMVRKCWPGALTVVVRVKNERVPKLVSGGRMTVGLRVPDHKLVQKLIENLGEGIVAASANFAGGVAPKKLEEIDKKLLRMVDGVVKGEVGTGQASTVVDASGDELVVLRQGEIKIKWGKQVIERGGENGV
jgi:L-threonylcarbamoyladenylate synthase